MQKDTWASSEREPHLWEVSILFKGTVFQVFVSPWVSHLLLSPLVNLSQAPPLGCECTP